jgi:hypothetical protein
VPAWRLLCDESCKDGRATIKRAALHPSQRATHMSPKANQSGSSSSGMVWMPLVSGSAVRGAVRKTIKSYRNQVAGWKPERGSTVNPSAEGICNSCNLFCLTVSEGTPRPPQNPQQHPPPTPHTPDLPHKHMHT